MNAKTDVKVMAASDTGGEGGRKDHPHPTSDIVDVDARSDCVDIVGIDGCGYVRADLLYADLESRAKASTMRDLMANGRHWGICKALADMPTPISLETDERSVAVSPLTPPPSATATAIRQPLQPPAGAAMELSLRS